MALASLAASPAPPDDVALQANAAHRYNRPGRDEAIEGILGNAAMRPDFSALPMVSLLYTFKEVTRASRTCAVNLTLMQPIGYLIRWMCNE